MRKLFYYELRRVLFRWMFLAMLAVNGMYAWYVLTTDLIRGAAYTAPFSIWSCCAYLGKTMPAASITVLLILCGYYSKKQKQVEILTSAAPMTGAQHLLIRSGVLAVCFILVSAVIMAVAVFFYSRFFQFYDYAGYILPGLLLILPCFVVLLGAGHLLAGVHQGLCYILIGICFAEALYAPDSAWDLFGSGYFAAYPLTLAPGIGGEPAYQMQTEWAVARGMYLVAGILLLGLKVRGTKRKLTMA